jgi:hypothetical protein
MTSNEYRSKYALSAKLLKESTDKKGNAIYYLHTGFTFDSIEISIAQMTVRDSNKTGKRWWVQMPGYSGGIGRFHHFIEVEPVEFWAAIEELCIEVLEEYLGMQGQPLPENLNTLPKRPVNPPTDPLDL